MILEEAGEHKETSSGRPYQVLMLSAKSERVAVAGGDGTVALAVRVVLGHLLAHLRQRHVHHVAEGVRGVGSDADPHGRAVAAANPLVLVRVAQVLPDVEVVP